MSNIRIPRMEGIRLPDLMRSPSIELNEDVLKNIQHPIYDQYADKAFENLLSLISEFENGLSDQFEVGAKLVNFGEQIIFHVEEIGFKNPSFIYFIGQNENGDRVQLVQHVNQINVLFVAMKAKNEKPRRIGFKRGSEI